MTWRSAGPGSRGARGGKRAAVVGALLCWPLGGCGRTSTAHRDAGVRAAQARAVARQAGLTPSVQDFLAHAAAASAVTYTVVYDQGAGQATTVMARPPDRRIDIRGATGAGTLDRVVVRDTATYVCHLTGARWGCSSGVTAAAPGPFTPDAVSQTIASLAQLSSGYDFSVSHRPMVGLDAACLSANRRLDHPADAAVGDRGVICIAPTGVILRIEGTGSPVQATSYRDSVPAGSFDLPAKPTP